MKCPKCGGKTTVVQVRENGRRRRQCLTKECRHSFHTKEVEVEPMACGGDRRSEQFKEARQ